MGHKSLVMEQRLQFTHALMCIRELLRCSVTYDLFLIIAMQVLLSYIGCQFLYILLK